VIPAGLSTEQAPPLSIPASFFATAPVWVVAAGGWLAVSDMPMSARFLPATIVATHFLTLGFLGFVMIGALYQMIPVVAGRKVPRPRLAHAVHAGAVAGLGALLHGLYTSNPTAIWLSAALLGSALWVFVVQVLIALVRAPTRSDTVRGMRAAVGGLIVVMAFGGGLAAGRVIPIPTVANPGAWLGAHVALGVVVWVGGLITAVSYQVIPMFYLTADIPSWARKTTLAGLGVTIVAPTVAVFAGATAVETAVSGALGAACVWLLHPIVAMHALVHRRRKRVDPSIRFWMVGLACGPFVLVAAALAFTLDHPRWPVLFGWLALWGWAGTIVHGMLGRIVPFLVWFHRFSPRVGAERVPSMRELLPDRRQHVALGLHLLALGLGTGAAGTGDATLATAAGLAVAATGVALGANLAHVLTRRPA
jgi:cbb3-type cytochrome oxidase subunit 1